MLLRVGDVAGYNNLIVISTDVQSLGLNSGLNRHDAAPPDAANHTGETGLVHPQKPAPTAPDSAPAISQPHEARDHEEEKTALVVGGIAIGLGLLWLLR